MFSTIAIVIVLFVVPSERSSSKFVWTSYNNDSGWSSQGYVILTGLLYSTFSFSGYEAGAHMAEETRNASKAAPWGLVSTTITVALVGFLYTLGLLYATTPDNYSNLEIMGVPGVFVAAAGQWGGLAMTIIYLVNIFFAGMASLTGASSCAHG